MLGGRAATQPHRDSGVARDRELIVQRCLRTVRFRVESIAATADDGVVKGIFNIWPGIWSAKEAGGIGFVVCVQALWRRSFKVIGHLIRTQGVMDSHERRWAARSDVGTGRGFLLDFTP